MTAGPASVYADFSGFEALRADARRDSPESLEAVARQFEGLFLQMLLKSMRATTSGDPLLGGAGGDVIQSLFDQQISLELGQTSGIGIADLMIEQLRQRPESESELIAAARRIVPGVAPPAFTPPRLPQSPIAPSITPPPMTPAPSTPPQIMSPLAGDVVIEPAAEPFTSSREFIAAIWPHAVDASRRLGTSARLLVAQAALETGWGGI